MIGLPTPEPAEEVALVEVRGLLAAVLVRPDTRRRFVRDLADHMRAERDREKSRADLRRPGGPRR